MTHFNSALLFLLSLLLTSSLSQSQVVIDVRSDTAAVTISDSVIILKRKLIDTPADKNLRLKLAEIYLQREMLDEAEQEVSEVLKVDTLFVPAITAMGRVYFQREPSKIIPFERLKEILKKDHKSKAINKFKEALALDANYKLARYFLARTYLEKGNPDNLNRAKDEFTRLFSENPDYQDVCYQLGYTYQKMKKYDDALNFYKRTRHKKDDFARANVRMAELYYENGNPTSATESFFQGIEELEDRELLDYLFEEQKIIMTKEELGEFENVPYSAKKRLIKKFWKRRDPDPATVENERLMEHFRRAKFARENFHFTAPPYYDDRGKIYIKYGQPDDRYSAPVSGLQAKDNESWTYESIEKGLVFDFVSESGYFHLVDDLSEAANAGADFNSRLAIASKLYNDRGHLSQAYASLTVGFSWDRLNRLRNQRYEAVAKYPGEIYIHDFKAKVFPFITRWAQFRGDSNKTRIELYTAFPGKELEFNKVDSHYINYTDFFIETLDTNLNSTYHLFERYSIILDTLEGMETRHFLLQNNFELPPGAYDFGFVMNNIDQSIKGVQKNHFYVKDFSIDRMAISDIQLSLKISENDSMHNQSIIKNDLSILPYPFSRVMKSKPIHLYFEIYYLPQDEDKKTNYKVSYILKTIQTERNLWEKTIGGIPRLFSNKRKNIISTTMNREGNSDTAFEYISLDLQNLDRGLTELKIKVTDQNSQQSAEAVIEFTLMK